MSVPFSHFAELDIVVGTILSAEIVPDADRLLQLQVEVGEEMPRQVISGIREFFPEPSELVGRQCLFVINLEPRTIRGMASHGMILAAYHGDDFALLHPSKMIPAGTPVR